MRLLGLRIRQFRRFQDAMYTFDPRLNVLVGPNEAGKSTVRHAILTAFFVNPATTSRRVAEWRPWGSESLGSIVLEFEVDGRRYELRKDFEHRRAELRDLHHGLSWEGTRAQEKVLAALGLPTEGLYRATAMIEQAEIATLRVGSADIGTRLSRVVQAGPGDQEAGAVIRRLEKEIAELERGIDRPVKNPGTIRRLQHDVEALQTQQADLQRRIARLDEQREELRRIRGEYDIAARELRDKEALLRENQGFLAMEVQLKPLHDEERALADRIGAIERGYARLQVLGRDLEALQAHGVPDDAGMERLHGAQGAVQARRDEVHQQERKVRTAGDRLEALATEAPAPPWSRMAMPVGGLLLVVALVAGALAAIRQVVLSLLPVLCGLAGLGLVYAEMRRQRRVAELRSEREAAAVRLEEAHSALATAQELLAREEQALQTLVGATGSASVEEALARHERFRALLQERTGVENQLAAHLGGGRLEELREALDRVRADIAGREAALLRPEAQAKRLTPLQVQQLEHDVKDLTQKVHRLAARQEQLERSTAEAAPDYETLVTIQEQLADGQDALEAARRKARVQRAAREGLHTARQQTLIPARRLVEERAGRYLSALTLGGYDRVQIEEPPLRIAVWVGSAGAWMEPSEPVLSRGTADQVYLAVRLALVEVLAEGNHPPLLLDDPFGTFDPERLRAAMALLRQVSQAHQVLLFTCRPEYEPFADRVLTLTDQPPPPELPGPLWQPPPPTH